MGTLATLPVLAEGRNLMAILADEPFDTILYRSLSHVMRLLMTVWHSPGAMLDDLATSLVESCFNLSYSSGSLLTMVEYLDLVKSKRSVTWRSVVKRRTYS